MSTLYGYWLYNAEGRFCRHATDTEAEVIEEMTAPDGGRMSLPEVIIQDQDYGQLTPRIER